MKKIKVGILGATGTVGQRFVQLLTDHPWFEIAHLCASVKSAGQQYGNVVNWRMSAQLPEKLADLKVKLCKPDFDAKLVFSALDSSVAGKIEEDFAKAGYIVVSNCKNHRVDPDVPLLIPEVNPEHLSLIKPQKKRWGSNGYIVTNPNCTTIGLTMVLKPLNDAFKIRQVIVTTMQALSGAGYPGVASLDALDNVVPYISDEEEKVESEPLKILGKVLKSSVSSASIQISAHCNRVAVTDGHLESVTLSFEQKPSMYEVIDTLKTFTSVPQQLRLPSAPKHPIIYHPDNYRPQPILDRDTGNGMSVVVGRVRESNVMDIRLTLLVHNTIRGAAGAAILNAELLKTKGYIYTPLKSNCK